MGRTFVRLVVTVAAVAVLAGCVMKKTFTACQQQVATCEQEKAALQEQVKSWEARFDQESQRWEGMQSTVTDALPQALREMNAERDRIVKLVPLQVQHEVEQYLDKYFDTVMKGFQRLQADNESLRQDLAETNAKLSSLGTDTSEIKSVSSTIDSKLDAERAKRAELAAKVADIAQMVAKFDQSRINCKDCKEKLGLNRNERETITAFHQELMTALTALQTESR